MERAEALEQLRALEHGIRIKAVETAYDTIGVDTPEDLERVRRSARREAPELSVRSTPSNHRERPTMQDQTAKSSNDGASARSNTSW